MFIHLSKKIAIPNGVQLRCLTWNLEQGWIACGGDNGLLKVLRLEGATAKDAKAAAGNGSNISLNQTLEGHSGSVVVAAWNNAFQKLTTSDDTGLIIVWMLHKGMWYEEMINNRNKSVVRDMKWTPNGEKICIVYEDGAVIVGSVDGNRMWGKELSMHLSLVEWSPDGRFILFGNNTGECHTFDGNGNAVARVPLYCNEDYTGACQIVGIEWYDGIEGFVEPDCPVLAVCLNNGRMQLMRHEMDDNAICIDTGMRPCKLKWNNNGSILAVSGAQAMPDGRELYLVQCYNQNGEHLRTLRVPGSGINGLAWEGTGLRLAMAVDSFIYFANVRHDYMWGYFGSTLVYAFTKPERPEHCVMFWDTNSNERYAKYVKRLVGIQAAGEYCVLATKGEKPDEHILILCNAIGSPVDSKYMDVEPKYLAITNYHVVAASDDIVYLWQFRNSFSKQLAVEAPVAATSSSGVGSTAAAAARLQQGRELMFHVDEPSASGTAPELFTAPVASTSDPISAICANDFCLMVGRASGIVNRYGLPAVAQDGQHLLRCRPHRLSLNCDGSRMAIIDINGVLSFFDLASGTADGSSQQGGSDSSAGEHLAFERKDAWDMCWADDNPELFATMEKNRMYVFRGTDPEEPATSTAFLCGFHDLEVRAALLDDIMQQPEQPELEMVVNYETRSLRDTRSLLASASQEDACQFINDNAHPRLWRILAEHSLQRLDFALAEKAFVHSSDYQGIHFVKSLQKLDDSRKQRAEVAVYFKRFEEAEALYAQMDRADLAVSMRMRLGDWFKVEKLIREGGGDDSELVNAWNKIGQYYSDRHKWAKAAQYYTQARNSEMLLECFYHLGDFGSLVRLVDMLPASSPLLLNIGDKLQSVGLCNDGVTAFLKGGDTKRAIDCCILLNQWDQAMDLAQQHNFPQAEALLLKYAGHLLEKQKYLEAVELYRKANLHNEAAKLMVDTARQLAAQKVQPMLVKKCYVLAALEIDRFRERTLGQNMDMDNATAAATMLNVGAPSGTATSAAAQTLAGLMTLDAASMSDARSLDNAWRGAEAYHFWLLAHRQLYSGQVDAALRTALQLCQYEEVLDGQDIYCFLGLAAFYSKFYGQCSKAFMKLESLPSIPKERRDAYAELAMSVFIKNTPVDQRSLKDADQRGSSSVKGSDVMLDDLLGDRAQVCVASGKAISQQASWLRCKVCKHPMLQAELNGRNTCPLCHSALPPISDRAAVKRGTSKLRQQALH